MTDVYAKIQNNEVIDILMTQDQDQDPSYEWIRLNGITCYDGNSVKIGCKYTGTNFYEPGTLQSIISSKLSLLQNSVLLYIEKNYEINSKIYFIGIYITSGQQNLPNRAAYVYQLMVWLLSIQGYLGLCMGTIQNMSDIDSVVDFTFNFNQFDLSNPHITLMGALMIND